MSAILEPRRVRTAVWTTIVIAILAVATVLALAGTPATALGDDGPYEPTWESLDRHDPSPEWFRDAKFGVYMHWGVYSTPQYGNEWYPRQMYTTDWIGDHHYATYGTWWDWPYHNFLLGANDANGNFVQFRPRLVSQGGQFDPAEWAQLFADSGAKFAGMAAEHHDGISLWDSEVNEWNTADEGPELDLVDQVSSAIREEDMKLFLSFHHAYQYNGFFSGVPTQPTESLRKLYGQLPRAEMDQLWFDKAKEVIDRFHPDVIWHDFALQGVATGPGACIEGPPCRVDEQKRLEYLAYYLNQAEARNQEVVNTYKHHDRGFTVRNSVADWERGGPGDITSPYWLTDDAVSPSSWSYTNGMSYYSARSLVHALIDRISKNGNMILNISPTAAGQIPSGQRNILQAMGGYLARNGEAVYDTRAWEIFGEGPTQMGGGTFSQPQEATAQDIRFTRSKNNKHLYATFLGWPGNGANVAITSLGGNKVDMSGLEEVKMLGATAGSYVNVGGFQKDADALRVTMPASAPVAGASGYVLKLTFEDSVPLPDLTNGANVYADTGFSGDFVKLAGKKYTSAELLDAGIVASDISSLRVADGFRLVAYSEDNFQGEQLVLEGDTAEIDPEFTVASLEVVGVVAHDLWTSQSGDKLSAIAEGLAPTQKSSVGTMEAPANAGSTMGQRLRALLVPPVDGEYRFWMASDDEGSLLLSRNQAGAGRREIAYVNTWSNPRGFDQAASQASKPIQLKAGHRYLIEAYSKENASDDHLAVAWSGPDFSREIIGSEHLEPATDAACPNWCPYGSPIDTGGTVMLANPVSGHAIDGKGVTTPGGNGVLDIRDTFGNQGWKLVPTDSGFFRIENQATGLVLNGAGGAEGTSVQQAAWTGSTQQQWSMSQYSGRNYLFQNRSSSLVLDSGGLVAAGSPLKQWTNNGSPNLRWRVTNLPAANAAPELDSIVGTPATGEAPLQVGFTSDAADPDSDALSYTWQFGDGEVSTDAEPEHTFDDPGDYTVSLTVTDGEFEASGSTGVTVDEPVVEPGTPVVGLDLRPKSRKAGKKAKTVSFTALLANTGDAESGVVKVCVSAPKKKLKVQGAKCRSLASLAAGGSASQVFKLKVKPKARGRKTKVSFVVSGASFPTRKVTATVTAKR